MAAIMTPEPGDSPWVPEDTFRNRLGLVRVALGGLNYKEAGELCGISGESWRRWENGEGSPRNLEQVCHKISTRTGLSYQWLIAGGPLNPGTSLGSRTGSFASLEAVEPRFGQGTLLDDSGAAVNFFIPPPLQLLIGCP
jgi:hypothetical protein